MSTTIFIAVAFSLLCLSPNSLAFNDSNLDSIADSHFLKDVLKAISVRQRWNLDEIRVSSLQVRKARVGRSQRYEFRVRVGNSVWMLKLSDDISSWRKVKKRGEIGSDLVRCANSKAVLKGFELEGPAEIRVDGDDELSMHFPLNTTLTGVKRVLVAEGITVQVKGAQEAIVHPSNFELPVKTRSATNPARQFWPFEYSMCTPLLPVQISGFASLVAYRTSNPNAHIESALLSRGVIQLLPDKCYSEHMSKTPRTPIQSLSSRLYILETLVSSFFGERILNDRVPLLLNAKLTASILVRFKLEIEREVGEDDSYLGTFADWRTKPTVERVWFEVVARVESDRLKPMVLKNFKPFVAVDTAPWSTLTSNVSFTHFPSALVPPEALTLDVKW